MSRKILSRCSFLKKRLRFLHMEDCSRTRIHRIDRPKRTSLVPSSNLAAGIHRHSGVLTHEWNTSQVKIDLEAPTSTVPCRALSSSIEYVGRIPVCHHYWKALWTGRIGANVGGSLGIIKDITGRRNYWWIISKASVMHIMSIYKIWGIAASAISVLRVSRYQARAKACDGEKLVIRQAGPP